MTAQPFYAPPRLNGDVSVSVDGGTTWHQIGNADDLTISGGEATTTDSSSLDGGTATTRGAIGPKTATFTLLGSLGTIGFNLAQSAYENNTSIRLRYRVSAAASSILTGSSSNTLAVATTGLVTGAGTFADFHTNDNVVSRAGLGLLLPSAATQRATNPNETTLLANFYILNAVARDASGDPVSISANKWDATAFPATALSANQHFQVFEFGGKWELDGRFTNFDNHSLASGSNFSMDVGFTQNTVGKIFTPVVGVYG